MVSQTVLFLIILTVWGILVRYFVEWPSVEICVIFFSWFTWDHMFRRKTTKVKCHSHLTISRVCIINMICHWHFYSVVFGRKSLCSLHLMSCKVCFSLLRMEYLHKLHGIFLQPEISFSLIFIQSFIQYELLSGFFFFWLNSLNDSIVRALSLSF